jgi:hypothetical protein
MSNKTKTSAKPTHMPASRFDGQTAIATAPSANPRDSKTDKPFGKDGIPGKTGIVG